MSIIAEALKKAEKHSAGGRTTVAKKAKSWALPSEEKIKRDKKLFSAPFRFAFSVITAVIIAAISLVYVLHERRVGEPSGGKDSSSYVVVEPDEKNIFSAPRKQEFLTFANVNEAISLSGIMYTPEKPLAVINGSIWAPGDKIGKFKIAEIGRDFVKVAAGYQEFVVRLKR